MEERTVKLLLSLLLGVLIMIFIIFFAYMYLIRFPYNVVIK